MERLRAADGAVERALAGAGEESLAVREAAERIERAVADELAQAPTLAGGKITVSRAGQIWSCASPCMLLSERFRALLARSPEMEARVAAMEGRAAALTGTEAATARQALAAEAAALEVELRMMSLPGDWVSPLRGAGDEFTELVKRRGSVAARLEIKPEGWRGVDEARFRYGNDALPEPGYRWVLDDDGALSYQRMSADAPLRQFDAATGTFIDAADDVAVRARYVEGSARTRRLEDMAPDVRRRLDATFAQRRSLIAERDLLDASPRPHTLATTERLSTLHGEIVRASEQLGERAARDYMGSIGGRLLYTGRGAGTFDQVWRVGDTFYVVEAKGGSSGLGTRMVEGVGRAEQGTREYFLAIARNMSSGPTAATRETGQELLEAIADNHVRYVRIRAPIGTSAGADALRDIQIAEFAL
jgi:hypothetical protein